MGGVRRGESCLASIGMETKEDFRVWNLPYPGINQPRFRLGRRVSQASQPLYTRMPHQNACYNPIMLGVFLSDGAARGARRKDSRSLKFLPFLCKSFVLAGTPTSAWRLTSIHPCYLAIFRGVVMVVVEEKVVGKASLDWIPGQLS